jgi:hypothetical protein
MFGDASSQIAYEMRLHESEKLPISYAAALLDGLHADAGQRQVGHDLVEYHETVTFIDLAASSEHLLAGLAVLVPGEAQGMRMRSRPTRVSPS